MNGKTAIGVVVVCLVLLRPSMASASQYVGFTVNQMHMVYSPTSATSGTLDVQPFNTYNGFPAILDVTQVDRATGAVVDSAQIAGVQYFDFDLHLTMTRLGPQNWSAAGTVTLSDLSHTNRIVATFTSTSMVITPISGVTSNFFVEGVLANSASAASILVPTLPSPWVFAGQNPITSPGSGDPIGGDQDGNPNTIAVPGQGSYDNGSLLMFQLAVPASSLDELFGASNDLYSLTSHVDGGVVPEPATLSLIGLGLSALLVRRKRQGK